MSGSALHPLRYSATVINVSRLDSKLRAYVSNKSVGIATPLIVVETMSWFFGQQFLPMRNQVASSLANGVPRRTP
jgi:hypothetical protein